MSKEKVSAKLDKEVYLKVIKHTEKIGSKIGKFYDIAAQEKLDRDVKKDKNFRDYETK